MRWGVIGGKAGKGGILGEFRCFFKETAIDEKRLARYDEKILL